MTDGFPVAKKFRIWNPAVTSSEELSSENQEEDETANSLRTQDEEAPDEKPLDCTAKSNQLPFPEIFQNYLQLAPLMMRLQQQRQMEELARRQLLSSLCHATATVTPSPVPLQMTLNASVSKPVTSSSSSSTSSASSTSSSGGALSMTNPIVATALGNQLVNENCCAVCGAVFRLTGDLVQHMRNNHRKSKFKRKADLRQ